MNPSLYTIKAMFILDSDGQRLVSKYYENLFETIKEEKEFEKNLFAKTSKTEGEIIMIDNLTIVYRSSIDLFFYVVGSTSENEIMLVSVLSCLFDSIGLILKKNMVEKKYLLDYLDATFLIINEICDNGILLETDPAQIVQRIGVKENSASDINSVGISGLLGEQSVMDVVKSAREQFKWSILR
jgi:hypothetical protein